MYNINRCIFGYAAHVLRYDWLYTSTAGHGIISLFVFWSGFQRYEASALPRLKYLKNPMPKVSILNSGGNDKESGGRFLTISYGRRERTLHTLLLL